MKSPLIQTPILRCLCGQNETCPSESESKKKKCCKSYKKAKRCKDCPKE